MVATDFRAEPTPVIVLSGLRARDEHGSLNGIDLALPSGPIGALIGSPADGTTVLSKVLVGRMRPRRGVVRIRGIDPGISPRIRMTLGSLLFDHELPSIGRVRDLLFFCKSLRGGEAPRDVWHDPLDIGELSSRSIATLSRRESRRVALGIALAAPSPTAIVLCDPLLATGVPAETLRPLLQSRIANGACVLIVTDSAIDAAAIADDVATIENGRVGRAIGSPDIDQLVPGRPAEIAVWCDNPRNLAASLVHDPSVCNLKFTSGDGHFPDVPVLLRATNPRDGALAVARAATACGIVIHAIRQSVPSASEVSAATIAMAQAAHRQNQQKAPPDTTTTPQPSSAPTAASTTESVDLRHS